MSSQRTFKAGVKSAETIHDDHRRQSIQLRKQSKEETISRRRKLVGGTVTPVDDFSEAIPPMTAGSLTDADVLAICMQLTHPTVAASSPDVLLGGLNRLTSALSQESMLLFGQGFALQRVIQCQVAAAMVPHLMTPMCRLPVLQFLAAATERVAVNAVIDQLADLPVSVVSMLMRIAEEAYTTHDTAVFDTCLVVLTQMADHRADVVIRDGGAVPQLLLLYQQRPLRIDMSAETITSECLEISSWSMLLWYYSMLLESLITHGANREVLVELYKFASYSFLRAYDVHDCSLQSNLWSDAMYILHHLANYDVVGDDSKMRMQVIARSLGNLVDETLLPQIRFQTLQWLNAMLMGSMGDSVAIELMTVTGQPVDPQMTSMHILDAIRFILKDPNDSPRMVAETLKLLSNVVACSESYATLVIEDSELIAALVERLGVEKWMIVTEVLYVFCNLACTHSLLLREIGLPACMWKTIAPMLRTSKSTFDLDLLTLVADTYCQWALCADTSWVVDCAGFEDVWETVQTNLGGTMVSSVEALVSWNAKREEEMTN